MSEWITDPKAGTDTIVDQVTYFRLTQQSSEQGAGRPAGPWWSVLIELEKISINEFQERVAEYARDLLIPAAYDMDDRKREFTFQPITIFARSNLVEYLNDKNNNTGVATVRLGGLVDKAFLDRRAEPGRQTPIKVPKGTVVQAFVDDGMGIAHDLFRDGPTSSRVYFAQIFDASPTVTSNTSIGRVLERAEINQLLSDCTFNGVLDEELFYTRSGQLDWAEDIFSTVALRRSHGTHVMGLGAGHDMDAGVDKHPIICAALPSRIVRETSGVDLLPIVYLSFHILVKQARRFHLPDGTLAPVVFNFSYGNQEGPHDGTGVYAAMFERYFNPAQQAQDAPHQSAWLTLPAGNANLERLHAVNAPDMTKDTITLDLVVLPDDRTPTHVQFWMPASAEHAQPNFAEISVRAPFGTADAMIDTQPGAHAGLVNDQGELVAWLAYEYVGGTTQRGLVTLSINQTATLRQATNLATPGIWKIRVKRRPNLSEDPIHIWIDRDETLLGHGGGGRQAFFDNPDYQRFGPFGAPLPVDPAGTDCPVRRASTISGFACGPSPIVVAAYTEKEAVLSGYSAAGPLNPSPHMAQPVRVGPDLAAKGDDSWVLHGVYSAGSRSGSWVRQSGTSVAAPQVARLAAQDITPTSSAGRAWAQQAVQDHPFQLADAPSQERTGDGAIALPDGGPVGH